MFLRNLTLFFLLTSSSIFSQEILYEQNFDGNKLDKGWNFGIWGPEDNKPKANYKFEKYGYKDNPALKVNIVKTSIDMNATKANISKMDIELKKNKQYKLSYRLRSRTFKDEIFISFFSSKVTGSNKPWSPLFHEKVKFKGDGSWNLIEHKISTYKKDIINTLDLKNLGISIGFNTRRGIFYIDDIKIIQL